MINNRSVLLISAIALILLALVPAVSALDVIYDRDLYEHIDTSKSGTQTFNYKGEFCFGSNAGFDRITFKDITKAQKLNYLVLEFPVDCGEWSNRTKIEDGRYDFTYHFNSKERPGVLYVNRKTNLLGGVTNTQFTIFLNDWDIGDLIGKQSIQLPFYLYYDPGKPYDMEKILFRGSTQSDTNVYLALPQASGYTQDIYILPRAGEDVIEIKITEVTGIEWKHHIKVEEGSTSYYIYIDGFIDGYRYNSTVNFWKDYELFSTFTNPGNELSRAYLKTEINLLEIISPQGIEYAYPLYADDTPADPDDPAEDSTLTVYIKNSQTGTLIANANVAIDALVDGEYYPVTNRTEPTGIFTITLQPTGGGKPNPDSYRLIVTADGYNNPMPEINFTVDDYKQYIYCLLDPIAGGPVNENKTFIDFFVRDMSSNPISGATVKFGKYTLITNSAGYTVFEVGKNNNYSWTVSKSGYGALTGNAVIGDSPRHTINTVLAPIVTPTPTTPIPTSPPIGPTPTMTAPTGEPVSNWLEWFAAHFGMILGGGVEIGKIFMWLCFTVPVGVYVGKESKAGAAGFMAGAGIVTLFFVLIGWVPIWLVVLLALIIGLLYAKTFNAPDNGGGR